MRRLQPRERRLVALGLLALALALLWLLLVAPVRAGFAERQLEREQLVLNYARNERIIAAMRGSRAALIEQRRSAGAFAFTAATPTLAAEALRERVIRTARGVGGQVGTVQEVEGGAENMVAARGEFQLTLDQMEELLRRLQNDQPYLLVRSLSVNAERAAVTQRTDVMDVRIEIAGRYVLAAAG